MVPPRTCVKVVTLDDDRDCGRSRVDHDQGVEDLARFIDVVIFSDGQDEVGVLRMDRKVGVAVGARL
jgi:hypothetical protein